MINDSEIRRVQSVDLMTKHERSFVIGVIGYYEAPRFGGARMAERMQMVTAHEIQCLRSFATWSRTHIKN